MRGQDVTKHPEHDRRGAALAFELVEDTGDKIGPDHLGCAHVRVHGLNNGTLVDPLGRDDGQPVPIRQSPRRERDTVERRLRDDAGSGCGNSESDRKIGCGTVERQLLAREHDQAARRRRSQSGYRLARPYPGHLRIQPIGTGHHGVRVKTAQCEELAQYDRHCSPFTHYSPFAATPGLVE